MGYLVQSYLDESAHRFPSKTSVSCNGGSIDYLQLYRRSNRLANCLKDIGVQRQDRVCIILHRSILFSEAVLGVLKADAVYVPIDPKSPPERWRQIILDCAPSAVICNVKTSQALERLMEDILPIPRLIGYETDGASGGGAYPTGYIQPEDIQAYDDRSPRYENIDTDLAYVLYTSGSTGTPKGVMVSHLNIQNYIEWAIECFHITENDRILGTAPFHFDMSTFDIYCALKTGAALHIATEAQMLFPAKLVGLIESGKITLWKGISSLLMYMARTKSLAPGGMPTLRKVLFGGEPLQTRYVIEWMKTFPEKEFYNVYGPTEATGISTFHRLDRIPENPDNPIPIGKACTNTEILLLKEDGTEASEGETGELCIRGSGLSRGYWADVPKTRSAFVTNPKTGMPGDRIYRTGDIAWRDKEQVLHFTGRLDHQVKYMGYRIDLSEIETAMASVSGVGEAVVILSVADPKQPDELIGFYDADSGIDAATLFNRLNERLPSYMIPRRIIPLEHIPRNDRGKIDRSVLHQYGVN
jgi:amino acid adenylation domain-containing protein